MPTYDYDCAACGPFDALRPMAERDAPLPCPGCGAPAPRVLLLAPALSSLPAEKKKAYAANERSAHSPRCGCPAHPKKTDRKPPGFAARRPWMIGH